ncbi:hypothetical protein ZWY2020_047620 [Hordeum vulgare]|nr:hypothetical protein ZWY2020_047620 [Hordeum vulgare]
MKKASIISILVTTFFYLCCGCFSRAGSNAGNLLTGFGFYEPYWGALLSSIDDFKHVYNHKSELIYLPSFHLSPPLLRRTTGRPRSPPPTPQAGSAMALYRRATSVIRRRGAPTMLPARAMASLLGQVEPAPKDPIFGVTFPLSPPLPFPAPATDRSAKKPTTYPSSRIRHGAVLTYPFSRM